MMVHLPPGCTVIGTPWAIEAANGPSVGRSVMVRSLVPALNSVSGRSLTATLASPKLRLVGLNVTADPTPKPVSPKGCGVSSALSLRSRLPLRCPGRPGVKTTLMTQLALIASVPRHALGWGRQKSPAVVVRFATTSGAVPTLVNVIGLAGLDLPRSIGPKSVPPLATNWTMGATPTPLRATESGLPPPSLVMTSRPPRAPMTLGVKTTPIEHDAPAPRLAGQAGVAVKSNGAVGLWIAPARVPLFLTVLLMERLDGPTSWFLESRVEGFRSIGYAASPVASTLVYAGSPVGSIAKVPVSPGARTSVELASLLA